MEVMKKYAVGLLLMPFGIFLAGGTAAASTTAILPGTETPLAEPSGILDQLYGLDNLQRVDDDNDQIWFPANGNATFKAKFGTATQEFGYIPDLNSDRNYDESFVPLFPVPAGPDGISPTGPTATLSSGNVNFLWALNQSGGNLLTSLPSQNSDTIDHMVTWLITGGAGNTAGNYVIAWEDLPGGGDQDFNDVVVEVDVSPIPIPPAVWLFVSGLLGLIGISRRKVM